MQDNPFNSQFAETLAKWYLRFNGYFTVENFILHAGGDPTRISKGKIAPYTEADILAIRHKHSKEIAGTLLIQNDIRLLPKQIPLLIF